jgi:hypothetical protein
MNLNNRLGYLLYKEFQDMTPEEQTEYQQHKMWVITNYMGMEPMSLDSIRLRTKAWMEETRTGFWD